MRLFYNKLSALITYCRLSGSIDDASSTFSLLSKFSKNVVATITGALIKMTIFVSQYSNNVVSIKKFTNV